MHRWEPWDWTPGCLLCRLAHHLQALWVPIGTSKMCLLGPAEGQEGAFVLSPGLCNPVWVL